MPATAKVTVNVQGEDFAITGRNILGGGFGTMTGREGAIGATVEALKFVEYGKVKVELIGPDWIKAELEKRGYNVTVQFPKEPPD